MPHSYYTHPLGLLDALKNFYINIDLEQSAKDFINERFGDLRIQLTKDQALLSNVDSAGLSPSQLKKTGQ